MTTEFLVLAQKADGDVFGRPTILTAETKMDALHKVFGDRPANDSRLFRVLVFELDGDHAGINVVFQPTSWASSDTWTKVEAGL